MHVDIEEQERKLIATFQLKQFIDSEKLELPVVLGQESMGGTLKVLMKKEELGLCSKDHEKFLASLQKNASDQSIALNIQSEEQ